MPGLYLHIPFCVKKCAYCDFVSMPVEGMDGCSLNALKESYLGALRREIAARKGEYENRAFDTVFFGGGTPSQMPCGFFSELFGFLRENLNITEGAEITVECNPGTVTLQKAEEYAAVGINRISLGLQSANDSILRRIGRIHTLQQFDGCMSILKRAGFDNINADVMFGLPDQSMRDYIETLEYVCGVGVKHISAYSLILEENTPLYRSVAAGEVTLPDADLTADMQDAGINFLESCGFRRYEVSNFAKAGFECKHNINYWENGEFLGIGAAAHSAYRGESGRLLRVENTSDVEQYIAGEYAPCAVMELSREDEMFDTVMMGFRMTNGIDTEAFWERFGCRIFERFGDRLNRLINCGLLELSGSRLRATKRGFDILNYVLTELMD